MMIDKLKADFSDYLVYERRLSEKTREAYLRELGFYLSYLEAQDLSYRSISPLALEEYLKKRRKEQSLEDGTISRIISTLRNFYRFLESREIVANNPALLLDKPDSKERLPKILSENEVEVILERIKSDDGELAIRDWCIFEVIYSSGLRISEAVGLNVSSYIEGENSMRVIGKRGKERVVFLGDRARKALDEYLGKVRPKLLSPKNKRENALFLNRRGDRMTRQAIHKRFHETVEALELDATVHTLRHSFATHMMQNGADVRSVQEMLGHSDVKTTQIYTHFDTSSLLSIFDKYSPLGDNDDRDN